VYTPDSIHPVWLRRAGPPENDVKCMILSF
jgi:hypothetical protein